MHTYTRVIPRDLFNEAKLLKCLGRLSLLIHEEKAPKGLFMHANNGDHRFVMHNTGMLSIKWPTLSIMMNGVTLTFGIYANNRTPYPLELVYGDDEVRVFDDEGNFEDEFLEFLKTINPCT